MQKETRNCQNCKKDFLIEPDDFGFYEKMQVPPPTFCPECRFQRRFAWRNEGSFYKVKCSLCAASIITIHPPENKFPVHCYDCWWGDKWDPMAYAKEYDFSKPFFVQFKELLDAVPALNIWAFSNVNSDYSNYTGFSKNSYLCNAVYCEDVFYSRSLERSKNCSDCYMVVNSELCYECFNTTKSFNSSYLSDCRECIDSHFLYDCYNCQNCFMCSSLRNKSFHIRNKQYSKEEYMKELERMNLSSRKSVETLKSEFEGMKADSIHKYANIVRSVDSDGDYISNSKNARYSFMAEGENLKFCWRTTDGVKDCYDVSGCVKNELIYEASLAAVDSYRSSFYTHSKSLNDCSLVHLCASSSDLFGCVGVKNKSYCVLNKQYTKEEYETLVPKIIKHMDEMPYVDKKGRIYRYGEFFPAEFSSFAYNETVAHEYFPLTKEEALEQGYRWKEKEEKNHKTDIKAEKLPDDIKEAADEIAEKVIECAHKGSCDESCTGAFKIILNELQLYRRMNVPLPVLCPNCRYFQRIRQRNPLKLWHRKCMNEGCRNEFETTYAPDRPETVYCESCYQKEVY